VGQLGGCLDGDSVMSVAGASDRLRALIYTRVSKDPKGRGRSTREQETECRQVCDDAGWDVVEVVTDNHRSASR